MNAWEMRSALFESWLRCRHAPDTAVVIRSSSVIGRYYHVKGVREVEHYGRTLVVLDVGEELS